MEWSVLKVEEVGDGRGDEKWVRSWALQEWFPRLEALYNGHVSVGM